MKRVLSLGQCAVDHASLARLLAGQFNADVVAAHDLPEALDQLRAGGFDLVLVNRKFDLDGGDGLDAIRQIKAEARLAGVAVMLVSNFPEAQAAAVEAGAEPGFGKAQLATPETRERLARLLL